MPHDPVHRALIPCGGRGTRMLALTGGAPKELLPVAGIPALGWVARECAASGIDEVLIVIAPGKEAIVDYLEPLAGTDGIPRRISFVVQPEARGLADAIRLGRDFAAGGPLAVALPDNLFVDGEPALAQVIASYRQTGLSAVAIVEILASDADRRGATAVYDGTLAGDDFHIATIPDKGDRAARFETGGAASAFTAVGRYAFAPELFDTIDAVARALPPTAELDDVPVMQRLLAEGRLLGRLIRGHFLDLGLPEGYREADEFLGRHG